MLTPARSSEAEWMDRPGNARADLEGALRDIRLVNRMLGGRRVLLRAVAPFLEDLPPGGTLRLLDIGTGGADLPLALVEYARARARRVEVVALDRDAVTAGIARRQASAHPEVRVVQADALAAPFAAGAFDVVTASLMLHHFERPRAVELLRHCLRLARRAVLVNDLRRHLLPWLFILVAARLTRRHPMFVHDAPLSVRRGFTPAELLELARDAGAGGARVERRWPYRLLLTVPCPGAGS